ncbi:hypothetical protein ES703_90728 [subsurface metagenome]
MKKLLYVVVAILLFVGVIHAQEWIAESIELTESIGLYEMFARMADGIVYCHSDRTKTTGVVVKKTSTGSWILTAGHKVEMDFPQASKINVKVDRGRGSKTYISLEGSIIVPEERGLDLVLFFIEGLKTKYVFKRFRVPYQYEENWVFGFRGGAGKVPGSVGYVAGYFVERGFVFTSASVWYGCSGAPVVNRRGDALGLIVRLANPPSTDGLFVSGKLVKEFIERALVLQKK